MRIDETWYARPPGVRDRLSAGGVVVRLEGERILVALVREAGMDEGDWVLPKGGVEKGETLEVAARREIAEEAGFTDLTLLAALGTRERLGYGKGVWITTHYFLFRTHQESATPTDTDYQDQPTWFSLEELPPFFWPEQREFIETHRATITASLKVDKP